MSEKQEFEVGEPVKLRLTESWLKDFDGSVVVVKEIVDPDNDLYRVDLGFGSSLEVGGSEMVKLGQPCPLRHGHPDPGYVCPAPAGHPEDPADL